MSGVTGVAVNPSQARRAESRPSPADLVRKARELQPIFREQAAASEALGKLTDEAFGAIRQSGLLGMQLPACYGGAECNTLEVLEILEAVSYADGATGWVMMATQVATCLSAVLLPDAAANKIYGAGEPVVMSGQGAPRGRAEVVPGGYRLTGRWSYASGILHSNYTHGGAVVTENGVPRMRADGRMPVVRSFVVPISEVKLEGNWDVMGLRATGSLDYSITDVFVPEEFTHVPDDVNHLRGGSFYSMGIVGLTTIGHTGVIIGIGRRILDELAEIIAGKPQGHGGLLPALAGASNYHEGFGRAEARLRSSRAFIFDAWGDLQKSLDRGDPPSTRQYTLIRLALQHGTSEIVELCTWAFKMAGGVALREGVVQRCFRDAYAAMQHFIVSPTMLQECGRELAGLAKGEKWTVLGPRKPA